MGYIFTSEEHIAEMKQRVSTDARLKWELTNLAEKYLATAPVSVTFHKSPAVSGNPHDYFSEGTYWWPDEKNPNGPYIRRDGEHNPNVFKHHTNDMSTLCEAVSVLCFAGLYLEENKYYEKAIEFLKVWFLDEETKMSEHLQYAQAIRGVCDGRSIGIIDTARFIKVIYAADILDKTGLYTEEIAGLKEWFAKYANWLNTSENGLGEKNYFNNHANWWNSQVAAFCAFCGNDQLLYECFDKFKNDILVNQLNSDGGFTDELTRTNSYTYNAMNLDCCTVICEIAKNRGVDLWNYTAENGNSVKKAVEFYKPFYENPFLWKYEQISVNGAFYERIGMKLAAKQYGDAEIEKVNESRRKNTIPCSVTSYMGALDLI